MICSRLSFASAYDDGRVPAVPSLVDRRDRHPAKSHQRGVSGRVCCAPSMSLTACTTCLACDYTDQRAGRHRQEQQVQSYVKSRTHQLSPQRLVTDAVLSDVQSSYSEAVYGRSGRVVLRSLRILWLRHLSPPTLRALARVGLCYKTARPPLNPFYWYHWAHAHVHAHVMTCFCLWLPDQSSPSKWANTPLLESGSCAGRTAPQPLARALRSAATHVPVARGGHRYGCGDARIRRSQAARAAAAAAPAELRQPLERAPRVALLLPYAVDPSLTCP